MYHCGERMNGGDERTSDVISPDKVLTCIHWLLDVELPGSSTKGTKTTGLLSTVLLPRSASSSQVPNYARESQHGDLVQARTSCEPTELHRPHGYFGIMDLEDQEVNLQTKIKR